MFSSKVNVPPPVAMTALSRWRVERRTSRSRLRKYGSPCCAKRSLIDDLLRRLDQLIEIEEGSAEARRQLAPDRRLAGAHEADEIDFHVEAVD